MMKKPMVFILFMMLMGFSFASSATNTYTYCNGDTILLVTSDTACITENSHFVSSDSSKTIINRKKERLVSALLAFPFPFGFMGAHRLMLGTKPWIPVVYVASFGGCFGLLPLIDFCVITFSKDIQQYENNPRLFMWIK